MARTSSKPVVDTNEKDEYGNDSIDVQVGEKRIRKRPASMLGSSGIDGARHGFIEIYGNALDEGTKRLDVVYYADGSLSVRDYGSGVPLGWNSKEDAKNWNWHLIYNELYSGGKFEKHQDRLKRITDWSKFDASEYKYLYTVGMNGVGAASTQYTSSFFDVKSYRNGKCTSRSFRAGMPLVAGEPYNMFKATKEEIKKIPEEICDTDEPDGTFIHWKPDEKVFDDINIGADWLFERVKEIANISSVEIHFKNELTGEETIIPAGGLKDIVALNMGGIDKVPLNTNGEPDIITLHEMSHGQIVVEGEPFIFVAEANVAFTTGKSTTEILCFHNQVKMLEGVQYAAVNDAIAQFMKDKAKKKNIKLEQEDYKKIFCVAVSSFSNYSSFKGQTKYGVDNTFLYDLIKDMMYNELQMEYTKENPLVIEAVEKVIKNAEIRIAAREYTKNLKENEKIKKEKIPEKFASCDAYAKQQYDITELWITEGDSAKGAVKNARDSSFQAIYAIKGKGLNVEKASISKILANKEIREMFALLGTGMDLKIKGQSSFNIKDLKFNKIIFATDADEDGYHIRDLLFLIFYRLAPKLIEEGHVYIAETPRFGITVKDMKKVIYVRNDAERDAVIAKYGDKIKNIQRYKGLGEVNAEVLSETTVHPATRTLIPVTCDMTSSVEKQLIDTLFGADKYNNRKRVISSLIDSDITRLMKENEIMLKEIEKQNISAGIKYQEV